MQAILIAALTQLDPQNDDHWTGEGLPRLDVVRSLAGVATLTRENLNAAAPGFTRTSAPAAVAGDPVQPPVDAPAVLEDVPAAPVAGTDAASAVDSGTQDSEWEPGIPELRAALERLQLARTELDKELKAAQDALDAALDAVGGSQPSDSPSVAVSAYLRAQQAERDARAERLRNISMTPADLAAARELLGQLTPSKIDSALAGRKSTRA